jgi:hypothetical protein
MNFYLKKKDVKELKKLQSMIDSSPVLFVKIPEIDKYLHKTSKSSSKSPLSTSPASQPNSPPSSSNSSATANTSGSSPASVAMQPSSPPNLIIENTTPQQQTQVKHFLKYLLLSSHSQQQLSSSSANHANTFTIFVQLCEHKLLNIMPSSNGTSIEDLAYFYDFSSYTQNIASAGMAGSRPNVWSTVPLVIESELCEKWHVFMPTLVAFTKRYLKSFSVRGTTILFKFHEYCLSKFINFAFEMVGFFRFLCVQVEIVSKSHYEENLLDIFFCSSYVQQHRFSTRENFSLTRENFSLTRENFSLVVIVD